MELGTLTSTARWPTELGGLDLGWSERVERFNKRRHGRDRFDCGNDTLNDWLATKVSQWEKKDLCRTYVAVDADSQVLGYYTLSSHHVDYAALDDSAAKGMPRIDVPVALLGRLAVDCSTQGQGLGRFLLLNALSRVAQLSEDLGIIAVEVDAIDEDARSFYLKYGFTSLEDDIQHLFLSMKCIRERKLPAP